MLRKVGGFQQPLLTNAPTCPDSRAWQRRGSSCSINRCRLCAGVFRLFPRGLCWNLLLGRFTYLGCLVAAIPCESNSDRVTVLKYIAASYIAERGGAPPEHAGLFLVRGHVPFFLGNFIIVLPKGLES